MKDPNREKLITIFLPNLAGGGAERSMVTLANGIAERGYKVHLVLAKNQGVYFKEVSAGIDFHVLDSPRTIFSAPLLAHYIRRYRPYALISALENANLAAIWARWLLASDPVLVISERSLSNLLFRGHHRRELRMLPFLASIFYRFADYIVAVSKGVARDLINRKFPSKKIRVIYNPLDIERITVLGEEPVLHPWFSEKKIPIIVAVGRLSKEKNFGLLLSAFELLLKRMETRLLILGEGEERPNLERFIAELGISDKVDLPGFDPNPFKYMKRADVFVLPSRFEGLPGALLQAMALGTPVVATDCPGGNREILEDGKWGALVPVGDSTRMAEAILDGINKRLPDPSPRAQDFSVEKSVNQYLNLIGLS